MLGAVAGAVISGIGGYKSGKAKKKAAKEQLKQMQKALQMYQIGSTDAYGNTLSADKNGRWGYNLSRGSQAAVNVANRANLDAEKYKKKSNLDLLDRNFIGMDQASKQVANAGQSAALRRGLQTGSNLGYISNAYNNNNTQNMRNQLLSAYRNSDATQYNANNLSALINNQINAQVPVTNIQNNLKDMVNTLNKTQMDQQNAIAGASANPYLHGQDTADLLKGVGQGIGDLSQHFNDNKKYNQLMKVLLAKYGVN